MNAKKWQKNVLVISYNVIWDYFVLLPSLVKVVARVTLTMIHIALLIYKGWLTFIWFLPDLLSCVPRAEIYIGLQVVCVLRQTIPGLWKAAGFWLGRLAS